jgi:hypothetical protein
MNQWESVQPYFEHYLREPSLENFWLLRDAVALLPDYQPYEDYRPTAYSLLAQEKFAEVAQYLMSKMPGWILNPGIHNLLAFLFHKSGDEDRARVEYVLAQLLLGTIISTGDGSEAHPYIVSSIADEYDVLEYLGKDLKLQALVEKGERRYDRLDCTDGSRIWFDITMPLSHLEKTFRQ